MKSKMLFVFVALVLLSPNLTLAFVPENGTASKVSNDTWLYINTIPALAQKVISDLLQIPQSELFPEETPKLV